MTAGAVAGSLVGPAGAAAGAALGSAAEQCAEKGINHSIDKRYQTDAGTYNNFDGGEFVKEIVIDGLGSGASSSVGKHASRAVVGESLKVGGQVVTKNVGRHVGKRADEGVVGKGAKSVAKEFFR